MTHMRRISVPKTWPIPKKGKKRYIVKPTKALERSLPLLVVLRDLMRMASTRREIKKIIRENEIFVNAKRVVEDNFPVSILDIISLPKLKKFIRLNFNDSGKISIEEIKENDADKKICKVTGKKILGKEKIQLNFFNGENLISDAKVKVNDSILFDFKNKKIMKILPIEKNAKIKLINGKHRGKEGIISKIEGNVIKIKIDNVETETRKENIIVTG